MKNNILSKSAILSIVLTAITACSSTTEPTEAKTTAQAEPVTPVKVATEVTAKIDKSGLALPIKNQGTVVGYKYKRSFMIPAAKGNFFGFSYNANQALAVTANGTDTQVQSEVKSSLPVTIKVTHPEMKQGNGAVTTESSWRDTLYFGRPNHTIWQFESDNELVSGKWVMSVNYEGKSLVEKSFLVKKLPPMPKKLTQVCSADESLYPPQLAKAHQDCCNNNDAQACYNFAWRGVERLKDIKGAVLYYGKGCDLGDASSCRTAGQKAEDEEQKKMWFGKGCKLKDLDSCLEIGKTSF